MLLTTYKEDGDLFYTNFLEATSAGDKMSYRGDLVLIAGEVGDELGHKKPPKAILREAVILADDKIHMLLGGLDDVNNLQLILDKYGKDFADDVKVMLFIVNLKSAGKLSWEGKELILIPLVQGVPWNECMEEVRLEKSDFKGQKPGDKLLTMLDGINDYDPKYPAVTLEEACATATNAKRELQGAV